MYKIVEVDFKKRWGKSVLYGKKFHESKGNDRITANSRSLLINISTRF